MERDSLSSVFTRVEMEVEKISTQRDEMPEESVDVAEKGIAVSSLPKLEQGGDGLHKSVTAQDWNGPDDPENPQNWPLWQRIYHTYVFWGNFFFLTSLKITCKLRVVVLEARGP